MQNTVCFQLDEKHIKHKYWKKYDKNVTVAYFWVVG